MRLAISFYCLFLFAQLSAQNVAINSDGSPPDSSAILDVASHMAGVLIPRMNSMQRLAITSPANALLVFDSDTESFWYSSSEGWREIALNEDRDWLIESSGSNLVENEDNMYHTGKVAIGVDSTTYQLTVQGSDPLVLDVLSKKDIVLPGLDSAIGIRSVLIGDGDGVGEFVGTLNKVSPTNAGSVLGVRNSISGGGSQLGVHNLLSDSSYRKIGVWNQIEGPSAFTISGTANSIYSPSDELQMAVQNTIDGDGNGTHIGTATILSGTGDGVQYGSWHILDNSGAGAHAGVFSNLKGNGSGDLRGTYNIVSGNDSANYYGAYQVMTGDGAGDRYGAFHQMVTGGPARQFGLYNSFPTHGLGTRTGVHSEFTGSGSAEIKGVVNDIRTAGTGDQYGVYSDLDSAGSGRKYGNYTLISSNSASTSYGSYRSMMHDGTGQQIGSVNLLSGSSAGGHVGQLNDISGLGDKQGVQNIFNGGSDNGEIKGVINDITSYGSGDHYGVYNTTAGLGTGKRFGVYSLIDGSGEGDELKGVYNEIVALSNSVHVGVENVLSSPGDGEHTGIDNLLIGSGSGDHIGTKNDLGGSGTGDQIGTQNSITNSGNGNQYGSKSSFNGNGSGTFYGSYSSFNGLGTGARYGAYHTIAGQVNINNTRVGVYNDVSGYSGTTHGVWNDISGTTGTVFGSYNDVSSNADGMSYGSYNVVSGASGSIAGYFDAPGAIAAIFDEGHVGVNNSAGPYNFHVASDNNLDMFWIDGDQDKIGIGTSTPEVILHVDDGTDASLAGGGYIMTNSSAAKNIVIDHDEIMARDNGSTSTLYLQDSGGDLRIHSGLAETYEAIFKEDGKVGIGDNVPSDKLHVHAQSGENALRVQVDGATRLRVYDNGHATIGFNSGSHTYGLMLQNAATIGEGKAFDWSIYSDRRVKSNIQAIPYGLYEILQLRPVRYLHHSSVYHEDGTMQLKGGSTSPQLGFLAQEVFEVVPEAVSRPVNEATDLWTMNYSRIVPVLVKATQELSTINERLIDKVENQQAHLEELQRQVKELREIVMRH